MSGGGTCPARHSVLGSGAAPLVLCACHVPQRRLAIQTEFVQRMQYQACPLPFCRSCGDQQPNPPLHPPPPLHPSLDINSKARKSLINQGGIIEDCFSPGEMSTRGREEGWDAWLRWDARLHSLRPWGMRYYSAGHIEACVTVPSSCYLPRQQPHAAPEPLPQARTP